MLTHRGLCCVKNCYVYFSQFHLNRSCEEAVLTWRKALGLLWSWYLVKPTDSNYDLIMCALFNWTWSDRKRMYCITSVRMRTEIAALHRTSFSPNKRNICVTIPLMLVRCVLATDLCSVRLSNHSIQRFCKTFLKSYLETNHSRQAIAWCLRIAISTNFILGLPILSCGQNDNFSIYRSVCCCRN